MDFSDLLTILEIIISVVVGFYLAHWYSVRDSQHRAVKDYYIKLLLEYRQLAEEIFHGVLDSSVSGSAMLSKIDDLDSALEGFDEDLRRALPVKLRGLQLQIGDVMDKLTDLNDINTQLDDKCFRLGTNDIIIVRQLSKVAHRIFGVYINQININQGHHVWHELVSNCKSSVSYYRSVNAKFPHWRVLWGLICAFWSRLLVLVLFLFLIFTVWNSYKNQSLAEEQEKKELKIWRDAVRHEMGVHNTLIEQHEERTP